MAVRSTRSRRYRIIGISVFLLALSAGGCGTRPAIPDEQTAIAAACKRIHLQYHTSGPCSLIDFRANLDGDVWTVAEILPDGYIGGGVYVLLAKSDGHIIESSFTQ
jgi:hypothetical protein